MLKIENFEFEEYDYFDYDDLVTIDASINPIKLESFIEFVNDYRKSGKYFDFTIETKSYNGRFGKFVFDKKGKMRFYIVTKELESSGKPYNLTILENDVAYYNAIRAIKHLESNNKLLIDLLLEKNIISTKEAEKFDTFLPFRNDIYYIGSEVNDLETYLYDTFDTIDDVKKEYDD